MLWTPQSVLGQYEIYSWSLSECQWCLGAVGEGAWGISGLSLHRLHFNCDGMCCFHLRKAYRVIYVIVSVTYGLDPNRICRSEGSCKRQQGGQKSKLSGVCLFRINQESLVPTATVCQLLNSLCCLHIPHLEVSNF